MRENLQKFRRVLFVLICVLCSSMIFSIDVRAEIISGKCGQDEEEDNVIWEYNDETYELTISGTGKMQDYDRYWSSSPAEYENDSPWGEYASDIKTLNIEEGVTYIGEFSFFHCTKLENVNISQGLKAIGSYAFQDCDAISEIDLPKGIEEIGDDVFSSCNKLEHITLSEGLVKIGDFAFYDCNCLSKIIIPDTVEQIGYSAFISCSALKEASISDNVETLSNSIFKGCTSLESVKLPQNLKIIGESAFNECKKINNVSIPSGVLEIREQAFINCESLEKITLPDSLEVIGYEAFYCCRSITSINLPQSLNNIDACAFVGCSELEEITIPEKIDIISVGVFSDCTNLKNVTLSSNISQIGESAFMHCKNLNDIQFGENIKIIGESAFADCDSLKDVVIPANVNSIGRYAFQDCDQLEKVRILSDVEELFGTFEKCKKLETVEILSNIPDLRDTFFKCENLSEVTLSKNTKTIYRAFQECSNLESIILPVGIEDLTQAFKDCTKLKNINLPYGVTSIDYCFDNCSSLKEIDIPDSVEEINNGSWDNWYDKGVGAFSCCTSLEKVTLSKKLKTLGSYSFYGCTKLENVFLPEGIENIGMKCFSACYSLKTINIPSSTSAIPNRMFEYCYELENISIASGITEIGENAFYECTSLSEIDIPNTTTKIGYQAFYNCSNLKKVSLSDSLETITGYTFYGCTSLKNIKIKDSVKSIYYGAFRDCKGLESIIIPEGVETISAYCFQGCSLLKTIVIPDSVTSIIDDDAEAFSDCIFLRIITVKNSCADKFAKDHNIPVSYIDSISSYGRSVKSFDNISYVSIDEEEEIRFTLKTESYSDLKTAVDNLFCYTKGGLELLDYFCDEIKKEEDYNDEYSLIIHITVRGDKYNTNSGIGIAFNDTSDTYFSKINVLDSDENMDLVKIKDISVKYKSELNNDQYGSMNIKWGFDYFTQNASVYQNNLAISSLILSRSIEAGKLDAESTLKKLGFNNINVNNYENNETGLGRISFALASREYMYHGTKKVLIAVVCRGTMNWNDARNDIASIYIDSFGISASNVHKWINQYINTYELNEKYTKNNIKFLVTGHSLGGVTANLLAHELEANTSGENIYAYTFASPCGTDDSIRLNNVFNILNEEDIVPHIPTKAVLSQKPRHGKDIWFNRKNYEPYIYNRFNAITDNGNLRDTMEAVSFDLVKKKLWAHSCDTYLAYLLTRSDADELWTYKIRCAKVACPVDVEIYAPSGELIGKVKDNKIDETIDQGVLIEVVGDVKYIYFIYEGDYTLKLTGSESGSMTYSIQDVDVETGTVENEKVFKNVSLEKGKEMVSTVSNDSDQNSQDIKDTELFVTDEKGDTTKKIDTNGKETVVEKATEAQKTTEQPTTEKQPSTEKKTTQSTTQAPTQATTSQPATTQPSTTGKTDKKVKAPSKVTLKSAKNEKSKKLTAKWKKVKDAKGYQVEWALDSKFKKSKKSKTIKGNTNKSLTFTAKNLKKSKVYYVRVRAYKTDAKGKKVYGKWSTVKKVKIKK